MVLPAPAAFSLTLTLLVHVDPCLQRTTEERRPFSSPIEVLKGRLADLQYGRRGGGAVSVLVATDFGDESQCNTYPLLSQMLLGFAAIAGACGEWTGISLNGAEKMTWGADGKALHGAFC